MVVWYVKIREQKCSDCGKTLRGGYYRFMGKRCYNCLDRWQNNMFKNIK